MKYFSTSGESVLFQQESCSKRESQDECCKSMNILKKIYLEFLKQIFFTIHTKTLKKKSNMTVKDKPVDPFHLRSQYLYF